MILAGNSVLMKDGSTKLVEDILVGDQVLDWKGQVETVEGISSQIIGNPDWKCYKINNTLSVTENHGLVGSDGNFYAVSRARYFWPYRLAYVSANHVISSSFNWGVNPDATLPLILGTQVDAYLNTSQNISSIEEIPTPVDQTVYTHKVSNSGTYVVGGLAVHAWPNILWDWKNWAPLPEGTTVTVIRRTDNGVFELHQNFDPTTVDYSYTKWEPETGKFSGIISPSSSTTGPAEAGGPTIVA